MPLPQTTVVPPHWAAGREPAEWLTPREIARCHEPVSGRRRTDKIAGRLALKELLLQDFGIVPLSYEIGSAGPAPVLVGWPGPAGLVVSLSHSEGWGAASWAWEAAEETVGTDIQRIRPVHAGLAARALADYEEAQGADILLLWALKEAAIKARRQPWGRSLRSVVAVLDHPDAESGHARMEIAGERPLWACYSRWADCWLARASRPTRVSG